ASRHETRRRSPSEVRNKGHVASRSSLAMISVAPWRRQSFRASDNFGRSVRLPDSTSVTSATSSGRRSREQRSAVLPAQARTGPPGPKASLRGTPKPKRWGGVERGGGWRLKPRERQENDVASTIPAASPLYFPSDSRDLRHMTLPLMSLEY